MPIHALRKFAVLGAASILVASACHVQVQLEGAIGTDPDAGHNLTAPGVKG